MTRLRIFLLRITIFLLMVAVITALLWPTLKTSFFANAPLNSLIAGVFLFGVGLNIREILRLFPELAWIDAYSNNETTPDEKNLKLLVPMTKMLGKNRESLRLSTLSMRFLLDGINMRLEESRDISRYVLGLLVFLGLLGTFWGLLETISSVAAVIDGLSVESGGNLQVVFEELKKGLKTPLGGMGTAFSSSLFGLGGSVVLGFLDLQSSQAQNRFFNDLEEWLSGLTRLSSGALGGDGEHGVPVYLQALIEEMAENLDNLQRLLKRDEKARGSIGLSISALTKTMETMNDQMQSGHEVVRFSSQTQENLLRELNAGVAQIKIPESAASNIVDDAARKYLRNMDHNLTRLLDEMASSRTETVQELRSEIRVLARTMAAATAIKTDSGS